MAERPWYEEDNELLNLPHEEYLRLKAERFAEEDRKPELAPVDKSLKWEEPEYDIPWSGEIENNKDVLSNIGDLADVAMGDLRSAGLDDEKQTALDVLTSFSPSGMSKHAVHAMAPIMLWGKGLAKGERIGKAPRNAVSAIIKERNPEKVHFHRTKAEYADDIERDGLKLKSKNYGENTGDADEYSNVLWLGDQPDEIPVLRRYGDGYPRYAPEVETFKVTEPKEVYEKRQRFQFPKGRGSGRMESRTGKQNSWTNEGDYKIDIYGEDIGPEYLQRMPKDVTPEQLEELDNFNHWKVRGSNGLDRTRMLAADRAALEKATFKTSPKHRMQGMEAAAKYTKAQPANFDWDRYAEEIKGVRGPKNNPHYAAVESYKPATSNRPWNDAKKSWTEMDDAFSTGAVSRGTDNKVLREGNYAYADKKMYNNLKKSIANDPNSAMGYYQALWDDYHLNNFADAMEEYERRGFNVRQFGQPEADAAWKEIAKDIRRKSFEQFTTDNPKMNDYVKNFLAKKWRIY